MRSSTISPFARDGEVLVALQHAPLTHLEVLGKQVGQSPDTIRRTIARLTEAGVLAGVAPLVNLKPLGFLDVQVFFAWAPEFAEQRQRILTALVQDERIAWVATLGGEFDVGILIPARSAEGAWAVLEELGHRLGAFIGRKSIAIRRSFTAYGRRHLAPRIKSPTPFILNDQAGRFEADALDLAMLSIISRGDNISARDVARKLGISHATVDRRVRNLEKAGVIAGWIYRVNPSPLGLQTYRLMIATKGLDPDRATLIHNFCKNTPQVIKCFDNIGAWDYEIEVDAREAEQVQELIGALTKSIGSGVDRITTFQVFRQLKYHGYPFNRPETL